jgi:membrane fusion protein, multidrug efflux system
MFKRYTVVVTILTLIFGGTFAWYLIRASLMKKFFAKFQAPAMTVASATVQSQTWHPKLYSVGTIKAVDGVNVNAEVPGQVTKIFFKSGEPVRKGDLLVELDTALDQQTLNNDLAQYHLNKMTYQRQIKLYKTRATAKSAVDAAEAKMLQSQSQVKKDQVMIDKKHVRAPFSGKLGIRQVNIGQYVSAGTSMVLLQSMNPLHVDFNLPQQELQKIYHGQPVSIKLDSQPHRSFKGKVSAINSSVQVSTRSIAIQAILNNNDGLLYPGLFVDVNVELPQRTHVITVPQTAINYSLYGDSVYIIQKSKDKNNAPSLIAIQRFVHVGERRGTVVSIKKGLKVGSRIVTAGQLKLHSGARIIINNSVKMK